MTSIIYAKNIGYTELKVKKGNSLIFGYFQSYRWAIDPNVNSQIILTSVLATGDAVGETLNEMALQMATGDLYSMVTFPDLTKTDQMSIIWNWTLSFI